MAGDQPTSTKGGSLFRDITAEDDDPEIIELESLCVKCYKQGVTRLFPTRIPFFQEVVVSSFSCQHCGCRNAALQPAAAIQDKGVTFTLTVHSTQDLNRQVVRSQAATIRIPCVEFEAPAKTGVLTTVEGIITQTIEDLSGDQEARRKANPEVADKIDQFVEKMKKLLTVETPFDIEVDDPSGNSFVENPLAPQRDPQLGLVHYVRSSQQDAALGLTSQEEEASGSEVGVKDGDFDTTNEVLHFQTSCPGCGAPCETNMKPVNIPYFKEVVIMATTCERCGHRDNEVKCGGGMEEKGRKITLHIKGRDDMSRDVLKSETSSVLIPDLQFETEMGTLGGKFTTVEGLLDDIATQLRKDNPFALGDSSQADTKTNMAAFCDKLQEVMQGGRSVTLILDDPAGNSYIQSLTAPEPDPQLTVQDYTRSFQQNEELGLNDMKTENYQQS